MINKQPNPEQDSELKSKVDEVVSHWLKGFVNGSQGITYTANNISQGIMQLIQTSAQEAEQEATINALEWSIAQDGVANLYERVRSELNQLKDSSKK